MSGRNSCRGTPLARSTSKTRVGGTRRHCERACAVTPSAAANAREVPTFSIAASSAGSRTVWLMKPRVKRHFTKSQAR